MEDIFWKILAAIGAALLAMVLARIATIAAARRVSYAAIGSKLIELWRFGEPKKHEMFVELTKLVIDGNNDLYPAIENFVDAVNNGHPDAAAKLLNLLDAMRNTASLAAVKESFLSSGPPREALFAKLLIK